MKKRKSQIDSDEVSYAKESEDTVIEATDKVEKHRKKKKSLGTELEMESAWEETESSKPVKQKKKKDKECDESSPEKKSKMDTKPKSISSETAGLDPEVEEMKRKKREKMRKKKEQKVEQKAAQVAQQEAGGGKQAEAAALQYLHTWADDKDNWKFQTVRQTWLLQHMYDEDKVPDADFEILLEYMDGLKGRGRTVTAEKAEQLMKKCDTDESESENSDAETDKKPKTDETKDTSESMTESQIARVRQVIQLLS